MTPHWPLVEDWDLKGISGSPVDDRISFGVDRGVPIDRPSSTGYMEVYSFRTPLLSLSELATLEAWFETTLKRATLPFALRNPITGKAGLWKIMSGDAHYKVNSVTSGFVQVSFNATRLPGDPIWLPYLLDGSSRPPYLFADYTNNLYGFDGKPATAAIVASKTGTFDLYTTYVNGAVVTELGRVLTGLEITNIWLHSEEFSNVAWIKNQATITPNATVAPDGTNTADKLVEDATNNAHFVAQNFDPGLGVIYTVSVYAKAAERQYLQLIFTNDAFGSTIVGVFDLSGAGVAAASTDGTAAITPVGDGWFRCTLTAVADVDDPGTAPQIRPVLAFTTAFGPYLGDGASGLYVWGAQLVAADHPGWYSGTAGTTSSLPDTVPVDAPPGVTLIRAFETT